MDQLKRSLEDIRGTDLTREVSIPIPAAIFGVLVSFMFGWTVGSMISRKHAAAECGHDAGWKHMKGIKQHHHHGDGPLCCCESDCGSESELADLDLS